MFLNVQHWGGGGGQSFFHLKPVFKPAWNSSDVRVKIDIIPQLLKGIACSYDKKKIFYSVLKLKKTSISWSFVAFCYFLLVKKQQKKLYNFKIQNFFQLQNVVETFLFGMISIFTRTSLEFHATLKTRTQLEFHMSLKIVLNWKKKPCPPPPLGCTFRAVLL